MKHNKGPLSELLQQAQALWNRRGWEAEAPTLVIGAMEELGELAQAVLLTQCSDFHPSPRKLEPEWDFARDIPREVGDTITYLLHLCNVLGIEPHFKWLEGGDVIEPSA